MASNNELMSAAEMKIVIAGGLSATLSKASGKPLVTIRRPSMDQREPDYRLVCDLNQWADICNAVHLMVGVMSSG